jgi:hypothetical protein
MSDYILNLIQVVSVDGSIKAHLGGVNGSLCRRVEQNAALHGQKSTVVKRGDVRRLVNEPRMCSWCSKAGYKMVLSAPPLDTPDTLQPALQDIRAYCGMLEELSRRLAPALDLEKVREMSRKARAAHLRREQEREADRKFRAFLNSRMQAANIQESNTTLQ